MSVRRKGEGGGGEAGALPPRPQQGAQLPAPTARGAHSRRASAAKGTSLEGHSPNGARRAVRWDPGGDAPWQGRGDSVPAPERENAHAAAPNIALAGFMGTGKSTVGRLLAERLGWRFVDTDALIEARAGVPIAHIFAEQGEPAFRRLEAEICRQVAAGRRQVIALGGGALLDAETRRHVQARALLVCLTAPLEEIVRRVGQDPARPLFHADRARLAALYQARAAHYASLPHHVATEGRAPAEIAEEIAHLWQQLTPSP